MADGVRLGIDWGKVRIGVAASNHDTDFAYPVTTVNAAPDEVDRLAGIVGEYAPEVVYVGLPLTLSGQHGTAAEFCARKAARLASVIAPVPVLLIDERLSTTSASRSLGESGRRVRKQRPVIDQAAAVEILQRALDAEAREGKPVGRPAPKEEL